MNRRPEPVSRLAPVVRPALGPLLVALLVAVPPATHGDAGDRHARERRAMADTIARLATKTGSETGLRTFSARTMRAMGTVPRHLFVPERRQGQAYENRPLPIGHGQTISQPYIVALMTDLLDLQPGAVVLEVGTGSGYQAAVLAELDATVHTLEIIPELARSARERLARLGYATVEARLGDGYDGWEAAAPFDAIVVTAAASHIPPPLVRQLKPGGRMVIPVGQKFLVQHLTVVSKDERGRVRTRQLLPVAFVPLTGGH